MGACRLGCSTRQAMHIPAQRVTGEPWTIAKFSIITRSELWFHSGYGRGWVITILIWTESPDSKLQLRLFPQLRGKVYAKLPPIPSKKLLISNFSKLHCHPCE
jgi:hypothetical protein